MLKQISAALALVAASSSAHAELLFTVRAVTDATSVWFEEGDEVTLEFRLIDSGIPCILDPTQMTFTQATADGPTLWESVTGTGIQGEWTYPEIGSGLSMLSLSPEGMLLIGVGVMPGQGLGSTLSMDDDTPVVLMALGMALTGNPIALPGEVVDATEFFTNHLGHYAVSNVMSGIRVSGSPSDSVVTLVPTSLDISVVPEPSTYAGLAGLGCLVLLVGRRWKTQRER